MNMMDFMEQSISKNQGTGLGGINMAELAPLFKMMKDSKKEKKEEEEEEEEREPLISPKLHNKICDLCDILASHYALQAAKTQLELQLIKKRAEK